MISGPVRAIEYGVERLPTAVGGCTPGGVANRSVGKAMPRKSRVRFAFPNRFRIRLYGDRCIYCGEDANSDEHWPPLAASVSAGGGFILPACIECNCIAGAAYPTSFARRALFVKRRLRSKYHRFLSHIEWSEEELSELSPKLAREFRAWRGTKHIIHERLAWNALAYFANIVQTSDFAVLAASLDFSADNAPNWFAELRLNLSNL